LANLREIFVRNLKENRRKCGFSQEKLAEKAEISAHYLAMLELTHNFPTAEVLERLAGALNIEVYELFVVSHSPKEELEKLRKDILNEIKQAIGENIEKVLADKCEKHGQK
jgi:transcriptional regulator with XRE-family HTH domain